MFGGNLLEADAGAGGNNMKLHTENVPGNLHEAATWINEKGWADYVVVMRYINTSTTIVVFKMPNAMVYKIRANDPSYIGDIHHDDEPCVTYPEDGGSDDE